MLKSLFARMAEHFPRARFFGFANGDILFTEDLVESLQYVDAVAQKSNWTRLFVTGTRTNVDFKQGSPLRNISEVKELAGRGKLYNFGTEDYFITMAHGFPWADIPPFVVGRVGYDNWLVATSILMRLPSVDLTRTVTAVHLTDADGNRAGHEAQSKRDSNLKLADKDFDYTLGSTNCIPFYTARQSRKNFMLYHRQVVRGPCHSALRRKRYNLSNFWKIWADICPLCRF